VIEVKYVCLVTYPFTYLYLFCLNYVLFQYSILEVFVLINIEINYIKISDLKKRYTYDNSAELLRVVQKQSLLAFIKGIFLDKYLN
jgi:hypothetical protein